MKRLLVFVFALVLLGSCSKNTEGCTDPNAIIIILMLLKTLAIAYLLLLAWEGVSWIPNGNNIIQNFDDFTFIVTQTVLGLVIRFH